MILRLITVFVLPFNTLCYDSESSEGNKIEMTPLHNTIILNDVADIINDFENNNSPYDILFSDSDSDENLEDLLSEYQHYLEKAHKQRANYLENKSKNKVPPLRHDKFSKAKPNSETKFSNMFYDKPFDNQMASIFSQDSFINPTDAFFSLRNIMKKNFIKDDAITSKIPENFSPREKQSYNEKDVLSLPPVMPHPVFDHIKSACYCKNGIIPCECNCKQCLMPWEVLDPNYMEPIKNLEEPYIPNILLHDNSGRDSLNNALNVRIKVDLQFPKPQEFAAKYLKLFKQDRTADRPEFNSKEFVATVPSPYFNFPIPMDIFGITKSLKVDQHEPLHKLSMHKRKKSKQNNNKKHRKKLITIHNYKTEPHKDLLLETGSNVSFKIANESKKILNITTEPTLKDADLSFTMNNTETVKDHAENNIYVTVNISNTGENNTDDTHKSENSIETDYSKTISNKTIILPTKVRARRQVVTDNKLNLNKSKTNEVKAVAERFHQNSVGSLKETGHLTKLEKDLVIDTELLYWPNNCHNISTPNLKNITTLILDNEHKKSKLNISKGSIRQNHTTLLEQAIFGHVNWSDVDAVTPAFMSFVGKYLHGILTFCSGNVCHSMKCAQKTCFHRVCEPAQRFNNRGHCMGSNSTDSIASMESIMDLPSNVAFEIVDILQNKMLGNLFGKATLCINSKCITFMASKKYFIKSRCSVKGLDTIGHCLNAKNEKII